MNTSTAAIRTKAVTRHLTAVSGTIPSIQKIRGEIRQRQQVCGDFTTIDTPLAPQSKTLFKAYISSQRLLLAVCLLDGRPGGQAAADCESVEIFFDPRRDGIGYWQYVFTPVAPEKWLTRHHLPYPECRSTAFPMLEPVKMQWLFQEPGTAADKTAKPDSTGRHRVQERWLFVWFERKSVFQDADPVGFNIGRIDDTGEVSSWNHSSGHGLQSPSSFGRLYASAPMTDLALEECILQGQDMKLQGKIEPGNPRPRLAWITPVGEKLPVKCQWRGDSWSATVKNAAELAGRHRLTVQPDAGNSAEPDLIPIDIIADAGADRSVGVGVTYDFNVNTWRAPAYTPAALDAEIALYAKHGVGRLYWIDFNYFTEFRKTSALVRQGEKNCGPFLELAAKLAKQRGLEFYGIFKPFDLLWNAKGSGPAAEAQLEILPKPFGRPGAAVSRAFELACAPELAVRRKPAVPRPPSSAIRRLELFSTVPLPELKQNQVELWISDDNISYRPYPGSFRLRQECRQRSHRRWSAAGNQPVPGSSKNWCVVIDDLKIDAAYAAITFTHQEMRIRQRAHAIIEACDDQGEICVIPAANGSRSQGFNFWTDWPSWANRSPRMLEELEWGAVNEAAVTFRVPEVLPSFIEPVSTAAHELWMYAVERVCATEADGISLRTLCHHKSAFDLLMYAYGPDVCARFRREYGREPNYDDADAERIRRLRGSAYSEFVQAASRRVRAAGKRFCMHFEAGIEVPPTMDQRMQMNLEWERWLEEGWLDEIVLKWWFAQNPYVHEKILPAARRAGVKVWLTGRNSSLRRTPRRVEHAAAIMSEALAAGFAGFSFYEAADWMERNVENVPEFHAQIGSALQAAANRV